MCIACVLYFGSLFLRTFVCMYSFSVTFCISFGPMSLALSTGRLDFDQPAWRTTCILFVYLSLLCTFINWSQLRVPILANDLWCVKGPATQGKMTRQRTVASCSWNSLLVRATVFILIKGGWPAVDGYSRRPLEKKKPFCFEFRELVPVVKY